MTAGLAGQSAEALQDVGDEWVRLNVSGTRERVVGVAFSLIWLTRRDRHPGVHGQRHRQVHPYRCRHGVAGAAASGGEIPARHGVAARVKGRAIS